MSQKAVEKARTQASALVPPGETVRRAVPVQTGPTIALSLGLLGVAFLKNRIVAITDTALYVMAAKAVERRVPLGSVAVSREKGPALWGGTLVIDQGKKMRLLKPFKEEADELAAAARVT